MTKTKGFSQRCNLRHICKLADSSECTRLCGIFIGLHGINGDGGRCGSASIPDEYRHLTLINSPAAVGQSVTYAELTKYVRTFNRQFDEDSPHIKSLYLYSAEPGTGKTTTAAAVLNEYINAHYIGSIQRNRQAVERPAYFVDVNSWQTDYNAFNRPRVPESVAEPAAKRYYRTQTLAQTAPFVVFDDIGVRDATEAFRADLHTVINARVSKGLPSVYTSNIPLINEKTGEVSAELVKLFDRRLVDRIREQCIVFTFKGESKRGVR